MAMVQVKSYNFSIVENPLSNGGNFTTIADADFTGVLKAIAGNLCEPTTAGTAAASFWSGAIAAPSGLWPNDHYAEITLTTIATGDFAYLLVRQGAAASGTQYLFSFSLGTSGTYTLYAIVSGSVHVLAGPTTINTAANDVIRLSITGNVLTATQNGSAFTGFPFTDTNNYIASGSPGFGLNAVTSIANAQTALVAFGANQCATPTFSPVSGIYASTQSVAITSTTAGSTIYYTTDGTTPTESSSSVANGGTVSISSSVTLKAIASKTNFVDSTVGSAIYDIGITGVSYTVTDTTIVAVWTTLNSLDSNLSAGGKAAIDNGVAANSTSHQCVVTGLKPNTAYSCVVTSGGISSSPSTQTTNVSPARILVTSAKNGAVTLGSTSNNESDTQRTFLSNDNKVYVTQDDGYGIVSGTPNAGYATQVAALSDESAMTGGASLLTNYGAFAETDGTDGPAADAMTNKSTGLFGLNGNLHMFVYRQYPPTYTSNRYANWIKSQDHGATWNNFTAPSTFVAGGVQISPHSPAEPVQFYDKTIGLVTPVLYAADDGTLGYNTAGNQIDGGNAYVYMQYFKDADSSGLYVMRLPRIQFDAQNAASMQYWAGPAYPSPLDFTNDANWSSSSSAAVNTAPRPIGWQQTYFVPTINSYVMSTYAKYNATGTTEFLTFSAPTPAGPWQLFFTQPNTVSNKEWVGPFPFHRDVVSNVATHDIGIKHLYSGASTNYCINYSTLTLNPASGASMVQLVNYGFTTVENPLSDGGNFSILGANTAMKVLSAGVCENTVVGTSTAQWSGGIPSGNTGGTWPADQYVEVTLSTLPTGSDVAYLFARASAALTYYLFIISSNGNQSTLYARVAGTLHSLATPSLTLTANDVIRLSVVGNVITVTQNGVSVQAFTDTNNYVPLAGPPAFGCTPATVITSPQFSNFAAGAFQAAAPTFSPVGGTYVGTQTVTINGPVASTIYYTTDGSTPTRSSSSISTGGTVSVVASQTLKAIASKTNFADSQVNGATYVIASGVYSVPDCRNFFIFPNASRTVQGTKIYDVQTSSNPAVPGTDSRAAGAPVDSRVSPNIPQNSRAPGTFGPGE